MRLWLLLFSLAPILAAAQGQGGQFGGRIAGDAEEIDQQLFLSPADRTEWTFDAKEREAVLVLVSSTVFDPAVAVQNEAGETLAENDDIAPGDQRAQLIFSVPQAGKNKVVVTNYKGTAGGAFQFSASRFFAIPTALGSQTRIAEGDKRAWARLDLSEPGDYSLSIAGGPLRVNVINPNGSMQAEPQRLEAADGRFRFTVSEPGPHYIRFSGFAPEVRLLPVRKLDAAAGQSISLSLEASQIVDMQLALKAGEVVRYALPAGPSPLRSAASISPQHGQVLDENDVLSQTTLRAWREGPAVATLWSTQPSAHDFEVKLEHPVMAMGGSGADGRLDWHGADFLAFQARIGDVIRLRASAPGYVVSMNVFVPSGGATPSDRLTLDGLVGQTLFITQTGEYIAVLKGGGVGAYRVEKEALPVRKITEREHRGSLKGGSPEVWRYVGKPGQDFAVRLSRTGAQVSVLVVDPQGKIAARLDGGSDFFRLRISEAGEYTFILSANGGDAEYQFKWVDLDG